MFEEVEEMTHIYMDTHCAGQMRQPKGPSHLACAMGNETERLQDMSKSPVANFYSNICISVARNHLTHGSAVAKNMTATRYCHTHGSPSVTPLNQLKA